MPLSNIIRGPFQLPSTDLNQALAEYEARISEPRNPLLDSPEAVARELLSPFNIGMAAGMKAVAPTVSKPPVSRNVGGSLLERNPLTNQWEVKFQPPAKPKGLDAAVRSEIKLLEAEIGEKRRALLKETDEEKQNKLALDIQAATFKLHRLFDQTKAASSPASQWLVDPMTIPAGAPKDVQYPKTAAEADALSMFGLPGERTPFAFSGGSAPPPSAASLPVQPPRIRILGIRRRE